VQVLGFVSVGGGLFLRFGDSVLPSILKPVLSTVVEKAGTLSASSSASSSSSSSLNDGLSSFSQLTSAADVAGYIFMALGVFVLIVGVVGCVGACCTVKALLAVVCIIFMDRHVTVYFTMYFLYHK